MTPPLKRIRLALAGMLVTISLSAMQTARPRLNASQTALADALARRDRSAFAGLLAPDATFFFPSAASGRDAIVAAWSRFFDTSGSTLVLTTSSLLVGTSGDMAYAAGRFVYRDASEGQDPPGSTRVSRGDFFAVWQLRNGDWTLQTFGATASESVVEASPAIRQPLATSVLPPVTVVEVPSRSPSPVEALSAPPSAGPGALTILAPDAKAYLTGPTPLRARVEPAGAASLVTFFVDGRQVCAVAAAPFECEWDAGRSIDAHQVRAVATLSAGGRLAQTVRTLGVSQPENVDVNVVQVTVTVPDGRGGFVRRLPASAFHVFEDGRPQRISSFVSENIPLELVVAVDISGSMASAMPMVKKAVQGFVGSVPRGNRVTLIGFNDTVFTLARRATSQTDLLQAVDRFVPSGTTALYDAILRGIETLEPETGRKVLVVFSDGEDQGSFATLADVTHRLQASDVTLYMIGLGRGATAVALKRVMEDLATPTGGVALFTESVDELHKSFAQLMDELSNQYFLSYPRPGGGRPGTWRAISVKVDGQSDVRARKGYRLAADR